jgi:hybrid cluster-associated redox disulfide protein
MKAKKERNRNGKAGKGLINAKMSFAEVMQKHPEAAEVFFRHGMACFGCPAAMMETLEQGIKAHGLEAGKIIDELNKAARKKGEK